MPASLVNRNMVKYGRALMQFLEPDNGRQHWFDTCPEELDKILNQSHNSAGFLYIEDNRLGWGDDKHVAERNGVRRDGAVGSE